MSSTAAGRANYVPLDWFIICNRVAHRTCVISNVHSQFELQTARTDKPYSIYSNILFFQKMNVFDPYTFVLTLFASTPNESPDFYF